MAERIVIAALVGTLNATLVWFVSAALRSPHLWPGTIMCFCITTATWLTFLRARR